MSVTGTTNMKSNEVYEAGLFSFFFSRSKYGTCEYEYSGTPLIRPPSGHGIWSY